MSIWSDHYLRVVNSVFYPYVTWCEWKVFGNFYVVIWLLLGGGFGLVCCVVVVWCGRVGEGIGVGL